MPGVWRIARKAQLFFHPVEPRLVAENGVAEGLTFFVFQCSKGVLRSLRFGNIFHRHDDRPISRSALEVPSWTIPLLPQCIVIFCQRYWTTNLWIWGNCPKTIKQRGCYRIIWLANKGCGPSRFRMQMRPCHLHFEIWHKKTQHGKAGDWLEVWYWWILETLTITSSKGPQKSMV